MSPCSIAPPAQTDLDEIRDYVANDNPPAAFHEKSLLMSRHPLLGQVRLEFRADVRSLSVGQYVICYRVREDHVHIAGILHGSRDVTVMFRRGCTSDRAVIAAVKARVAGPYEFKRSVRARVDLLGTP